MHFLTPSPALIVFAALSCAAASVEKSTCSCYRSSSGDCYTDRKFYDFRSLPLPDDIPRPDDRSGAGDLQSGFLLSQEWNRSWQIQHGLRKTQDSGSQEQEWSPVEMWNSRSNVFVDRNVLSNEDRKGTKLVLRTKRFGDFQSAAEIAFTRKDMLYASIRIHARVRGDIGAVAGLSINRDLDSRRNGIEVLTRDDHTEMRYGGKPGFDQNGHSTKLDLNTNLTHITRLGPALSDHRAIALAAHSNIKYTDFHTHRIDWVKDRTSYYVNDQLLLSKKSYPQKNSASSFVLGAWSDGNPLWSGKMALGDEARLEIEWIEVLFNTTSSVDSLGANYGNILQAKTTFMKAEREHCFTVCSVDDYEDPRDEVEERWRIPDRNFAIGIASGAVVATVLYMVDFWL